MWVFDYKEPIESVIYDGSEVCGAMWATTGKIREMMTAGEFVSASLNPYFDEMVEKWETANRASECPISSPLDFFHKQSAVLYAIDE